MTTTTNKPVIRRRFLDARWRHRALPACMILNLLTTAGIAHADGRDWPQIDTRNSTVRLISRSGEPNAPVMGERLQCEITLRDTQNNPIGGFPGDAITLVSREQGALHTQRLSGITCRETGRLYTSFAPQDPLCATAIRVAVKIGEQILDTMPRVKFSPAPERVDQCQPLWSGAIEIHGKLTIGQIFKTGATTKTIIRIKTMLKAGNPDAGYAQPVLRLYEWRGAYDATMTQSPIIEVREFQQGVRELLATFKLDVAVVPDQDYYFELASNDVAADNPEQSYKVWRNFTTEGDPYPRGTVVWRGRQHPDWNLMFFVFTHSGTE